MFTDVFGKIWYKGNLHTHTTNSDGAYTPEETIALYKSKNYDFLALTDHWFHGEGRQEENFLLLNSTEFNGIPFVPQKFRNFPAILEHRKIQANPL